MVGVSTRVDGNGFWYMVDCDENQQFLLSYVVIGSGGRISSGEVRGGTATEGGWRHVEVGFPVLHVGVTQFELGKEIAKAEPRPSPAKEESYRRKAALIALTSTTLSASSIFAHARSVSLPDLLSTRDGKIDVSATIQKASGTAGHHGIFNPY
jgi:hypothetical protein